MQHQEEATNYSDRYRLPSQALNAGRSYGNRNIPRIDDAIELTDRPSGSHYPLPPGYRKSMGSKRAPHQQHPVNRSHLFNREYNPNNHHHEDSVSPFDQDSGQYEPLAYSDSSTEPSVKPSVPPWLQMRRPVVSATEPSSSMLNRNHRPSTISVPKQIPNVPEKYHFERRNTIRELHDPRPFHHLSLANHLNQLPNHASPGRVKLAATQSSLNLGGLGQKLRQNFGANQLLNAAQDAEPNFGSPEETDAYFPGPKSLTSRKSFPFLGITDGTQVEENQSGTNTPEQHLSAAALAATMDDHFRSHGSQMTLPTLGAGNFEPDAYHGGSDLPSGFVEPGVEAIWCEYNPSIATSDLTELMDFDDREGSRLDSQSPVSEESEEEVNEQRYKDKTCYFEDGTTVVDYVLVYDNKTGPLSKSEQKAETRKRIYRLSFERKLKEMGLKLEHQIPEQSIFKDTAVVKIHATWEFLTKISALTGGRVPIARNDLLTAQETAPTEATGYRRYMTIPNELRAPKQRFFHAKFEKKFEECYYILDEDTFFTDIQRLYFVSYALHRVSVSRYKKSAGKRKKNRGEGGGGLSRNFKMGKNADDDSSGVLTLAQIVEKGIYKNYYPLHDSSLEDKPEYADLPPQKIPLRRWLYQYWARYANWYKYQPIDEIREYFGEQIAMYFAWLGHYTAMLVIPSILSLTCIVRGIYEIYTDRVLHEICDQNSVHNDSASGSSTICRLCPDLTCPYKKLGDECSKGHLQALFDHQTTNAYAIMMSIWTICFLSMWKRKQNKLAARWDTLEQGDKHQLLRAEYKRNVASTAVNQATMKKETRMKTKEKLRRMVTSIGFCLSFILVVICVLCGIQVYKMTSAAVYYKMQDHHPLLRKIGPTTMASVSGSVMNAVFISITNMLYSKLAWRFTVYEYPRTQEEFQNSYIYKVVLFQFINFYGLLLYMALFKGKFFTTPDQQTASIDQCRPIGCLPEIVIQLIIIMTGKQVINNVLEVGMPIVKNFLRKRGVDKKKRDADDVMTFSLPSMISSSNDNTEMEKEEEKKTRARWEEDLPLEEMSKNPVAFGDYLEMIIQYGVITMITAAFPAAAIFALINNVLEIFIITFISGKNPVAFGDYLEMIIQYGFITMFTAAFPPAAIFALINNVLEIRLDGQKYLGQCQRHRPHPARNIGPWEDILAIFTKVAVLVNAIILAFTTQFVDRIVYQFLPAFGRAAQYCHNHSDYNYAALDGYVDWRFTVFNTSLYSGHYHVEPPLNETNSNSSFFGKLKGLSKLGKFGASEYDSVDKYVEDMQTIKDHDGNVIERVEECYFIGKYKLNQDGTGYTTCPDFWYLLVAKIGFVVLFEHLVIISQTLIQYFIPEFPESVQSQVDRERYLTRQIFIRHEQEAVKSIKSGKGRKDHAKRRQSIMSAMDSNRTPIRIRDQAGTKRSKHSAKMAALRAKALKAKENVEHGGEKISRVKRIRKSIHSARSSVFSSRKHSGDNPEWVDPEPVAKVIQPGGRKSTYREAAKRKKIRKGRPFWMSVFHKMNYFC